MAYTAKTLSGAQGRVRQLERNYRELDSLAKKYQGDARRKSLLLAAMVRGAARWEALSSTALCGEVCLNGLRYSTHLDKDGCPVVNDVIMESLLKVHGTQPR